MQQEKLSEAFIAAFLQSYADLVEGKTGMIPESTITPVKSLPHLESLSSSVDSALLGKTVVLKLNGGLGTSTVSLRTPVSPARATSDSCGRDGYGIDREIWLGWPWGQGWDWDVGALRDL